MPRAKIRERLLEVGFDDDRQADIVGGLSGGWKMKLEGMGMQVAQATLSSNQETPFHQSLPYLTR